MAIDDPPKDRLRKHRRTASDIGSHQSVDEHLAASPRGNDETRTTTPSYMSHLNTRVGGNTDLQSPRIQPQYASSPSTSRVPGSPRPAPGRVGQDRLEFLHPRGAKVHRDFPEPGSLPEEARVPYMGPQYIDTRIPRRSSTSRRRTIGVSGGRTDAQIERREREIDSSLSEQGLQHYAEVLDERLGPASPYLTPPSSDRSDLQSEGETSTDSSALVEVFHHNNSGVGEHLLTETSSDVGSGSDATDHVQQTEELARHPQPPSGSPSISGASYARASPFRPSSQTSSMDSTDNILPLHMSPFDYAIGPYLQNSNDYSEVDVRDLPLPTEPSTPSVAQSSEDDIDSIAEFSHRNEQLYPHPAEDEHPDHHVESFLLNMSTEMRSRYINLRTVLSRCTLLASPRFGLSKESPAPPITNFHLISRLARGHALPIAKNLGLEGFQALSHYWVGRAEAGLRNWDGAEAAFEEALKLQVATRTDFRPKDQGRDAQIWLDRIRQQISGAGKADERKNVADVLERYDYYWDTVEDGDRVVMEASRDQIPAGWVPDGFVKRRSFSAEDRNYIKLGSYENQKAMKELEAMIAESQWKISQRKMNNWVSLWEETGCY